MLMDDYSLFAYCFLLRSKDETYTAVKQFLELVKTQHNMVVKQFHSDREGVNLKAKNLMKYWLQKE